MSAMHLIKRQWKYLVAKLSGRLEEAADPKVQLEQAMQDAQEQHRRLVEQASNVIAGQKQTEMALNQKTSEVEKLNGQARQALMMAEEAKESGDEAKAAEYSSTAEALANRLILTEGQTEELKVRQAQMVQAAGQAKTAVQQNSEQMQQQLAERQKLLSQLDQAKMQEQMNASMETLSSTVNQESPSLEQVQQKIEGRYAKALGTSELHHDSAEGRMLEVEQASRVTDAQGRLAQMREELQLPSGAGSQHELANGGAAPADTERGQDV